MKIKTWKCLRSYFFTNIARNFLVSLYTSPSDDIRGEKSREILVGEGKKLKIISFLAFDRKSTEG